MDVVREGAGVTPVLFIHDAAIDDFVATLLILESPNLDLRGVVIVNADCIPGPGMDVASRVHQFAGRPDLPLGLSGARGWNPFPWPYRGDCVTLGDIGCLASFQSTVPVPPPSGEALIVEALETAIARAEPLTILLTTGFTTLVDILKSRPDLARGISRVAWMGGALDHPGNLDPETINPAVANTHAEWNVFWDPFAADLGLATLPDIAVFPLDITDWAAITPAFMAQLQAQAADHSYSLFASEAYALVADEPYYDMWNVTVALWLISPELYATPRRTPLRVVQWGFEQGWMQTAPDGDGRPEQDVYLEFADLQGFYDRIVALLAN
jgi:purine nucleosidase